jgi:HPt (histidine-containing phosphotransfer) domain-containing protein
MTEGLFSEPKNLKNWAIKLANACGGQKVEKSIFLTKTNPQRIRELLDEFVEEHNKQTLAVMQELEEE